MSQLSIIIAGGGTGGHIFPAIAIAQAIRRLQPDAQLLFVGAVGKMEMEKVPQAGFDIVGLDIVGFNRANWLKNLLLPFKLLRSMQAARRILKDHKPDVVIGVGGYASFPMLNAAQGRGIPTLIQEQNSYAGKSNKILGKRASAICVAYSQMERFFPKERLYLTGNPVRKSISNAVFDRQAACAMFGLDSSKKTILVVGGSLGALSINQAIGDHLKQIAGNGVQLIWQTGKPYFEQARQQAIGNEDKVKVHAFISNIESAYAAADVVISRAGALAISELCIVGKPVIFVPYPFAAEDHQTSNAKALADQHAAWMIADKDVPVLLMPRVMQLIQDEATQHAMTQKLNELAIKDADERIACKVLEFAPNEKKQLWNLVS